MYNLLDFYLSILSRSISSTSAYLLIHDLVGGVLHGRVWESQLYSTTSLVNASTHGFFVPIFIPRHLNQLYIIIHFVDTSPLCVILPTLFLSFWVCLQVAFSFLFVSFCFDGRARYVWFALLWTPGEILGWKK